MKLASTFLSLVGASGISIVDGMSIRGNTKSANKLLKVSRRLQNNNGYYYNGQNGGNGYNNGGQYGGQNGGNGQQANNYYGGQYGGGQQQYGGQYNGGQQYGGQYGNNQGGNNQGGNNQYNQQAAMYGGYYGEMNEEDMYFLRDYSIKLLGCMQGEQVINYENGEMESSSVIFRLCPASSCDVNASNLGCEEGFGDYVVGINTFLDAYMEQEKENENNYYIAVNEYGNEFDAAEYAECAQFEMEDDDDDEDDDGQQQQNNYNNYNNYNGQYGGQQNNYYANAEFFVGPTCSADNSTIALGLFADEGCSYLTGVNFTDVYPKWSEGLPFSDGGLIPDTCIPCYGADDDGNWELSEICETNYVSSKSRCEQNMSYYSMYGQANQGCDYIDSLLSSIAIYNLEEDESDGDDSMAVTQFTNTMKTWEARLLISVLILFSVFFGGMVTTYLCRIKKRKKSDKLIEGTGEQPEEDFASSMIKKVQSGTMSIAKSVRTSVAVMSSSKKSSDVIKSNDKSESTSADYKGMEDDQVVLARGEAS